LNEDTTIEPLPEGFRREVAARLIAGGNLPDQVRALSLERGFRAFEPWDDVLTGFGGVSSPDIRRAAALEHLGTLDTRGGFDRRTRHGLFFSPEFQRFVDLGVQGDMASLTRGRPEPGPYKQPEYVQQVFAAEVASCVQEAQALAASIGLDDPRGLLDRKQARAIIADSIGRFGFQRHSRADIPVHWTFRRDCGFADIIFATDVSNRMHNRCALVPHGARHFDLWRDDSCHWIDLEHTLFALMAFGQPYRRPRDVRAELALSCHVYGGALDLLAQRLA
jgi:hypothetical protein